MSNPYPSFEMQQMARQQTPSQSPYQLMQSGQPQVQFASWNKNPDQQLSQESQIIPVSKFPKTRESELLSCRICQQPVQSRVEFKIGKGAALFSFLTLPKAPCCCVIPLLWKDFKDASHICPKCNNEIGRRHFLFERK